MCIRVIIMCSTKTIATNFDHTLRTTLYLTFNQKEAVIDARLVLINPTTYHISKMGCDEVCIDKLGKMINRICFDM